MEREKKLFITKLEDIQELKLFAGVSFTTRIPETKKVFCRQNMAKLVKL